MALPGVQTQVLDRFYALTRTDVPTGPRVAAIAKRKTADGFGEDSAVGGIRDLDTFIATSEKDVIDVFGENSNLHKAYVELLSGGAQRVVLVPLPADTIFNHNTASITSATWTSGGGGDLFDAAFDAAEAAQPDVIVAWGAGSSPTEWQNPATPGDDFASPSSSTGNADFFYADNSISSSWAQKVANKCAEITSRSFPCFGIIGVKPYIGVANSDGSLTASALSTYLSFPNLKDKETLTNGQYVSVVAAELRVLGAPDSWGYSNGACLYAGSIMRLDAQSATTGKIVFNTDRIRWNPTRTQLESMTTKGLVPAALDFERRIRWIDGTTFAKTGSDYSRLSTLRITFDAVKLVRSVAQNYVGEGSTTEIRAAFETQISSALRGMALLNALITSDFRVTYVPVENKAIVDLALRPAFELREIVISVAVNF